MLPPLPTFTAAGLTQGFDLLAAAASTNHPAGAEPTPQPARLHTKGPFNPAASLPPKTVKKVLNLKFVEMAELRGDMWIEDPPAGEATQAARCPQASCYGHQTLVGVLFPDGGHPGDPLPRKGPRALGLPNDNFEGGP